MTADKKPQIERKQTDDSLRQERNGADQALAEQSKRKQDEADDNAERSRDRADEVIRVVREKEDKNPNPDEPGEVAADDDVRESVMEKRDEEDEALSQERAAADENLRWEREEQARILAALIPLGREETDSHLLEERYLSDSEVEHRDDFMGIISHEMGNLLFSIAIDVRQLVGQTADSDEGKRMRNDMDRIKRSLARMHTLIHDLLDVAGIDSGKFALHPQPGDVAEMISEVRASFSHAAQEKGISLEFPTAGQKLPAVFDTERMLQVVANLIANAIQFTPSGGMIKLTAVHDGDDLRISVFDTGEGISEDLREKIFERFGQAGGNSRRGLGLGLYISKSIVEAQGGRIWAECNPSCNGSAFHFTIPAARHAPSATETKTPMLA